MYYRSTPGFESDRAALLSTLTTREVEVLRRRFGIEMSDVDEEIAPAAMFFLPPTDDNGGQGGAPLNTVEIIPVAGELGKGNSWRRKQRIYTTRKQ